MAARIGERGGEERATWRSSIATNGRALAATSRDPVKSRSAILSGGIHGEVAKATDLG
jgi:hypothetical protein